MKSRKKRTIAIALAVLLLLAVATGVAYNARLVEYAAVYVVEENMTVYTVIRAPSRGVAWAIAERRAPSYSTLHNVFRWTPPYPPPPSTWAEEEDIIE
jgi:hypothetical protein